MNTQEMIPVFTGSIHNESTQLVDARTLHRFLEVDAHFKDWIARRIAEYDFQEGEDFCSFLSKSGGGRPRREYSITLDMGKELAMVERNEKGRQARRYFIECEKRLQQIAPHEAATIRGQTIGTDGFHCLAAVVDGKVRHLPARMRRGAKNHIWSQVHKAFSVVSVEDIPASSMDGARNFIAAYALKGEWLPKEERKTGTFVLDEYQAQFVHSLIHYTHWVCCRWDQGIGAAVKALNPKFHAKTWEFFRDLRVCAEVLESAAPELVAHFRSRGALRPHDCIATGHPVGHPAD
ncbi:antA/AntB antirepressor family protein [Pseudomonas aeruginosa]|uniref:antA/AntB antirepressor family protein n=1 Tax=Pseudomonas aeruginosa TaxID=287 RepID=UPI00168048E0|nr:antA/AntB antirepressor family protein [Pseudomonas aeruginosa]MDI2300976.1 antA/AntB antirepressor family protein [Pseudomonas aeruginosa]HBN9555430.1 antA/AntB antirepressor family protein [Pseudomonas aeruginosa]HBN9695648.1 antA/AntB antirepressor family protein [Pseudomonas aeruginosa]